MSDTAPTPPADTRQQAAQAAHDQPGCCHLGCEQGACESCPCCCAGWCLNGGTDLPEDADDLRLWLELARGHGSALAPVGERLLAAALASSSPALPEPPAPSSTGVDNTTWHPVFSASVVADWSLGGVWSFGPDRRMTPAEARRLASTLLAAADVAEEQQP